MIGEVRALRLGAALGIGLLAAQPLPGCDAGGMQDGEGSGGDGTGGGGASAQEQQECKDACNQLKFFDCNDSTDQARCFTACEAASASAIELFVACVQADICDPSCSTNLYDQAGGGETGGGGSGVGGDGTGGGGGGGCVDACQEYVGAGCIEGVDCAAFCASLSPSDQGYAVYCVDHRNGCALPPECEEGLPGEADPTAQCQDACDSLQFFDCIDAQTHADCRTLCTSAATDDQETFISCVAGGVCQDGACYDVFAGGGGETGVTGGGGEVGGGGDVELCQSTCDQMEFFDCIDASQHSMCREVCTTATAESIDTFWSCAGGCEDDSCYVEFLAAQ